MGETVYAGIIIDQAHPSLDKIFHYSVPSNMRDFIKIGMRVTVPFGRKNSHIEGYVLQIDSNATVPDDKIKSIIKILDPNPLLNDAAIELIRWMKKEYHCLTIEAIHCFIPPGIRLNVKKKYEKVVYLQSKDDLDKKIKLIQKRSPNMAEILKVLDQHESMPLPEVLEITNSSTSSIKSLLKRGWIRIVEKEVYRQPYSFVQKIFEDPLTLSSDQARAIHMIEYALSRDRADYFLIHGVTGSGKTEVYMQVVQKAILQKKQAIVLVPEISLTPQIVTRFKRRFGNQIAILHSRLSLGERFDEWRKINNQEVNIVIGARSAIFAPLNKVGVIIIDEAHEASYKSETSPRYDALGIARKRCELEGAVMIIGSATPDIVDYYKVSTQDYKLIPMLHRIDNKPMPTVEIVDMRKEIEWGNRSTFSRQLFTCLRDTLNKNEQCILLLNRRGYAPFVSCRSCGFVLKCSNCEVSLTYHADSRKLKCHYCGQQYKYPSICPVCKSKYIKHFGIGTQKVEEDLLNFFPKAKVVRMDMDTTTRKGAHERILHDFKHQKYNILLGTQMIAKGLDFPNVTLVGIFAADTTLNLPEYKASERTFQLITQVAGRTGRGLKPGKVILQTYQPEHNAIQYAAQHDYIGFFQWETSIRRKFLYPPFSHIIKILVIGEREHSLISLSQSIREWIAEEIARDLILRKGIIGLGAYPAPLERINNKYRWQVLIKIHTETLFLQAFHHLIDQCLQQFREIQETIVVDFYPTSLL